MPSETPAVVRPGYGYSDRLRGIEHSRDTVSLVAFTGKPSVTSEAPDG